ncbi:MAG: hypothetical protein LBR22_08415 [Desulfovibrio sp.]|jgi:hypothetical protein|nr:hypothetical protein [Desulfovibrio sp.]
MIIIDGRRTEKEISNFGNLEEILTHVLEDKCMESRIVTDVLVNNEAFSEIYPHQAEDISCDSISSVEIVSTPADKMAVDMSGEMEKVTRLMGSGAKNVARLFRDAADADALELLQDTLDVTRDFMGMTGVLREAYGKGIDKSFNENTDRMSALLSEMSESLEHEDWILLADLLEYEFLPLCEEWGVFCSHMHKELASVVPN